MRGQPGFWDLDERYERLSAVGDPLEKLNSIIPWAVFEKPLAKALKRSDGSKGGRPPFPAVLMFKILALQALYNLSDDQAEFVIQDRLSFMRFLGLGLSDKVPDAKTIWLFRESLVRAGAIDNLFARFDKHLSRSGYLAKGGQIVDATIIQAPRQHNSQDEKDAIKAGEIPDEWKDKPAKLAQKDRDARWSRQCLSLEDQRGVAERQWPEVGHPPAKAEGQTNAGNDVAGKRATIKDQVRRRARLRQAKGQDEALHPHHWHQRGDGEDRHGQHRLQHAPLCLPRRATRHSMKHAAPKGP